MPTPMNNKTFTLLLLLAITSFAFGQDVALSYEVNSLDEEGYELNVYAQSYTESSFDLAALNFSTALPEGCVPMEKGFNMMSESWTDYLENGQEIEGLNLKYSSLAFESRFQYGNADPGLPATSAIILPPRSSEPMMLITRQFKGNCADLYLEHESENGLNQITGPAMEPVAYVISHPERTIIEKALDVVVIEVSPNPTADWVTVSLVDASDSWYTIKVFDLNGRLVYSQEKEMGPSSITSTAIDLRKEAAGVYVIEIVDKVRFLGHALNVVKQ